MELTELDSGSLVKLTQEGKETIYGKLHRIYGETFVEVTGDLFVLNAPGTFFFCAHPWVPYTQLPAKGWSQYRP